MYIHICSNVPVDVRPVGVGRVGRVAARARPEPGPGQNAELQCLHVTEKWTLQNMNFRKAEIWKR
jgi:hypothetical protein